MRAAIRAFLEQRPFAVVGASADRAKFGNRLFRHYLERELPVFAVNPRGGEVEGHRAWPSLAELPEPAAAVSIVTPPVITDIVVREALELGIEHLWLQPGAESEAAIALCAERGVALIHGGPCVLVELA